MKRMRRVICLLASMAMLLPGSIGVHAQNEVVADTAEISTEEKIPCNATIDQEFADDAVLVILDRNTGAINKVHSKDLFGGIAIENIVDLTAMPS